MTAGTFRFDDFVLNTANRQLRRDGAPVELNSRYFDALALLVGDPGALISKDRFLAEVWRGVPVTDEALTQCVKTLRRQLGDDATAPRFIETVPKHGYRFVASVERVTDMSSTSDVGPQRNWRQALLLAGAGTIGSGVAGVIGGLAYGFAGASQALETGAGAISVMLVLLMVTMAMALLGGLGVAVGIAAAGLISRRPWQWAIVGGALGGTAIGGVAKMLGLDAFNLLIGQSVGDFTGPMEGLILGGGVGLGAWLAFGGGQSRSARRCAGIAALSGAAAGLAIPLLGGRLMGGSLDLLAGAFSGSRLRLDEIGRLFGEQGFGPITQIVTGGLEGALFAGCIVGAMAIARRDFAGTFSNTPQPVHG